MPSNDFDVILYKILSYAYECLKMDVQPSVAKARELSGVGETYFATI